VNWFTLLIVFVFDPLAISMVIALNKLTKKDDRRNSNNIFSSVDGTSLHDTTSNQKEGVSEVPILREEVVKERIKTPKEKIKEVKKEKEEVEFIPTSEEAKKLYGEASKKNPSKVKHVYRNTSNK